MALSDALLGFASGAASVVNEDATKNRDFMRKQKAKIAESRLVRQEKQHDAKKAKWDAVQIYGTGDTGQYMHALSIFDDKDMAAAAVKEGMFAKTLLDVKDPGKFVPYEIGVSNEEFHSIYGNESMAGKLMSKFGKVKNRRQEFRDSERAGSVADAKALFQKTPELGVPTPSTLDGVEATLDGRDDLSAEFLEPSTAANPSAQKADEITKQQNIVTSPESTDAQVSAAQAALRGLGAQAEGRKLTDPEEVFFEGKTRFAQSDKSSGKWVIDGVEVEAGSVVPTANTPSALFERVNMIPAIDAALLEPNLDPERAATLERQRAIIMGNISKSAAGDLEKRARREGPLHAIIGTLETSQKNIANLAGLVTAEHSGPRALVTKLEDRISTYYEGIFGSKATAQDLINKYTLNADATPAQLEAYSTRVSNAFELGQVSFMAEMIKYDLAEALKRGDRLTANDLERVDTMITAPFGSDEFAAQLSKAQETVTDIYDNKVKEIMIGRQIAREDIVPAYDNKTGERVFFYKTIVKGKTKMNRFKL
jgi:hypothetical protein